MRTRPLVTSWNSPSRILLTLGLVLASRAAPAPAADPPSKVAPIDYNRQVRSILSDKCYACHGPDENQREASLRLDVRDEALAPADSGKPAIVPGKPDASPLIKRINSTNKGLLMPPPKSNKTLSAAEKQVLRDWIAQGASYQTHWAFRTPSRPALPSVKETAWVRNPIDRFILARLEAEGLKPAPEADRATLIRRLTLDLTGLPPTPAQVDAFLADGRPDAYERLVDRLLASPHHGERMALDWLDAARFADTHGFHIDSGRDMTRWRDWVINAFNTNLPFDRFTIEQLAGDLLPNATLDQKIASGFNRNHMITFEGGVIPEEYLNAYIVDRVNTTGTVWLGLSVACTQCHDHKYDPMTQKEFYQLYAFFNGVPESGVDGSKGNAAPMIKAPLPDQQAALARIDARIQALRSELDRPLPGEDLALAAWQGSTAAGAGVTWDALVPKTLKARAGTRLRAAEGGLITASGPNPSSETYVVTLATAVPAVTALRLELLSDPKLKGGGPGRSVNGNIVLTDFRIEAKRTRDAEARPVAIKSAAADFSQTNFPAMNAIDTDRQSGWAIDPETGKPHHLDIVLAEPLGPAELTVTLDFGSNFDGHQPGKFRLLATTALDPLRRTSLPDSIAAILRVDPWKRSDAQRDVLRRHFRAQVDPAGKSLAARLDALERDRAVVDAAIPTTMVMAAMPNPRDTFVRVRGAYDKLGERVEPNTPAFLPPLPADAPHDRLTLARWLVDPKQPLVGRVTVNRFWQTIFGTGIVRTAEDFGSQGEAPTHPELLDWLTVEFMSPARAGARGWDMKALLRLLVTSSTYRQRSSATPALVVKDPENRLLARGPRVRLPAEFVRDQALAVSGLLNPEVGGKSVSPYQPAGLWEELMSRADGKNWSAQVYEQSHGKDLYRRTMYTFWKRTSPPPSLATFDAPDRETCTVRRVRTNTPLQALVLLNDPTYVEASRKLAERILAESGSSTDDRMALAFRLCTARTPTAAETAVLNDVFRSDLARFQADRAAALKLLSVGESSRNTKLDPAEHAAWTTVASVILNLDEVLNKN